MQTGEGIGITIPRNYFNLSQEHAFSCEAGIIYPIYQELLFPGDLIKVSNECVIRQQPTINPSFSRFKAKTWDVVVAIRNLDKDIYRFMSGFKEYTSEKPWTEPLPKWTCNDAVKTKPGTLWDFLENPILTQLPEKWAQIDYFRQAYGYIWEILFRNETRQESILIDGKPGSWTGEDLLRVNWDRDYFTTSLPKQLLGEPGAIPIQGVGQATWDINNFDFGSVTGDFNTDDDTTKYRRTMIVVGGAGTNMYNNGNKATVRNGSIDAMTDYYKYSEATEQDKRGMQEVIDTLNNNKVQFSNAATVYLSQLSEMLAIECMQTINTIAGIRDDEFLRGHWGTAPSNEALQYPEVIGKNEVTILTSEVLQTSESTEKSTLGDMAGHGLGAGRSNQVTYHAKEFCIYLKLFYIKPETMYMGQGVNRAYTQNSIYDFPFPELNHIALQPIYGAELCAIGNTRTIQNKATKFLTFGNDDGTVDKDYNKDYNDKILGYQPNFEWYTQKRNRVSGLFKVEQYYETITGSGEYTKKIDYNLYNWTEARFFDIEPDNRPVINNDFLQCKLDNRNYSIVDDSLERAQFLVWHNNIVHAWRSLSAKRLPSMLGIRSGL